MASLNLLGVTRYSDTADVRQGYFTVCVVEMLMLSVLCIVIKGYRNVGLFITLTLGCFNVGYTSYCFSIFYMT